MPDNLAALAILVADAADAHESAHQACVVVEEKFVNTEDGSEEERVLDEQRLKAHDVCQNTHDTLTAALTAYRAAKSAS